MSVAWGRLLYPTPESPVGGCCGPAPWQSPLGVAGTYPHVWQCDDGRCVSSSWRCDGAADCLDGSDEQDCGMARCKCCCVPSVCGAKKVQCPGTHHCIPHWELCDRHQDCEDGWDEEGCPQQPCLPGQWQCRNRVCIMAEWKCNGTCADTHWGVQCSCGAGWELQADGQSCAGKEGTGCTRFGHTLRVGSCQSRCLCRNTCLIPAATRVSCLGLQRLCLGDIPAAAGALRGWGPGAGI
uniref:Uncharacterized protein n=1 Tax=Falco tinnunculus TaxID=100819 RepID=A0A8C4TPI9_FALTI